MKIVLNRFIRGPEATIGSLSVDGEWLCWTLEDTVREPAAPKVYGQTAIPAGTYHVIVNLSPRLKKRMPRLLNVPGFDGILIHKGNDAGDTSGCILVGAKVDSPTRISDCSKVFDELFQKIDYAYGSGEGVTIEIRNVWDDEPFSDLSTYEWSLQWKPIPHGVRDDKGKEQALHLLQSLLWRNPLRQRSQTKAVR